MTEEEFRNGPARQRPLSEYSDDPVPPSISNPLGQSERELEEARRLNAGMANRAAVDRAYRVEATGPDGDSASMRMDAERTDCPPVDPDVRGPMIRLPIIDDQGGEGDSWVHVDWIANINGGDEDGCVVWERNSMESRWNTSLTVDEVLSLIERASR